MKRSNKVFALKWLTLSAILQIGLAFQLMTGIRKFYAVAPLTLSGVYEQMKEGPLMFFGVPIFIGFVIALAVPPYGRD